jgi:ABC-type transporter Mla subunit MlaD
MYGDTEAIRGLARTMRGEAAALRSEATGLLTKAEAVPWTGLAADAMRSRVQAQVGSLRRTAELADDAAQALDRHADEVDRLKALIASIEHRVLGAMAAAKQRLAGLVGMAEGLVDGLVGSALPDPLDELLARFDPPPHGHRDWLSVSLPGLP